MSSENEPTILSFWTAIVHTQENEEQEASYNRILFQVYRHPYSLENKQKYSSSQDLLSSQILSPNENPINSQTLPDSNINSYIKIGGQVAMNNFGSPKPFPRVAQENFGRSSTSQSNGPIPFCLLLSTASQGGASPQGGGTTMYSRNTQMSSQGGRVSAPAKGGLFQHVTSEDRYSSSFQ